MKNELNKKIDQLISIHAGLNVINEDLNDITFCAEDGAKALALLNALRRSLVLSENLLVHAQIRLDNWKEKNRVQLFVEQLQAEQEALNGSSQNGNLGLESGLTLGDEVTGCNSCIHPDPRFCAESTILILMNLSGDDTDV